LRVCGAPLLPLDTATAHPGLEAGICNRSDRLAHLLGAPATVPQGTGNHVASECAPVADGEEILERCEHGVLDTVAPGREQRLGEQRSEERRVGKEWRT